MAKMRIVLNLDVSEETLAAIQEARQFDPAFLKTFMLMALQELVAEYDLANTPAR